VECLLKIVVLRRNYFSNAWSKLDFTMALLGLMSIIINFYFFHNPPVWARVIKSLRILRSLRLLKSIESITLLLNSIVESS